MDVSSTIGGKFRIERLLGRGGMGAVYLARDTTLGNRRVAVKILRFDSDDVRRRLEQEASAAANLAHPNIVVVHEYGLQDEHPYIVMEFIEGQPLSVWIAERREITLDRKLALLDELCAGLAFAHRQGIVHRDVKPGNLMVDAKDRLKILDFGIVQMPEGQRLTVGMLGTPNYMSPEQVNGDPIDQRSDIFAVGLVAYELITYQMAFPGESGRVYDLIRYKAPKPIESYMPGISPEIVATIMRAIEKEPRNRYQDLEEMRDRLAEIRRIAKYPSSGPIPNLAGDQGRLMPTPSEHLRKRRQQIVETHIANGNAALERGDLETAIDCFEQAAALDEHDTRGLRLLDSTRAELASRQANQLMDEAESCLGRQQFETAAELVNKARELSPSEPRIKSVDAAIQRARAIAAAIDRARTNLSAGVADAALQAASEAVALDPANAEAMALTRAALDQIAERQQRAEQARADEVVARATKALADGDLETAGSLAHEASVLFPRYAPVVDLVTRVSAAVTAVRVRAIAERAMVEKTAGRLREAMATLDEALAIDPSRVDLRTWREGVQADLAEAERAAEQASLQKVLADAQTEFEAGNRTEAIRMLERYEPKRNLVNEMLERLRSEAARLERAERERADRDRRIADLIGIALDRLTADRPDEAIARADAVLEIDPGHERARDIRSRALSRKTELDEARKKRHEERRRAAEIKEMVEGVLTQAQAASAEKAVQILRKALEEAPTNASLLKALELREAEMPKGKAPAKHVRSDEEETIDLRTKLAGGDLASRQPVAKPVAPNDPTIVVRPGKAPAAPPKPPPASQPPVRSEDVTVPMQRAAAEPVTTPAVVTSPPPSRDVTVLIPRAKGHGDAAPSRDVTVFIPKPDPRLAPQPAPAPTQHDKQPAAAGLSLATKAIAVVAAAAVLALVVWLSSRPDAPQQNVSPARTPAVPAASPPAPPSADRAGSLTVPAKPDPPPPAPERIAPVPQQHAGPPAAPSGPTSNSTPSVTSLEDQLAKMRASARAMQTSDPPESLRVVQQGLLLRPKDADLMGILAELGARARADVEAARARAKTAGAEPSANYKNAEAQVDRAVRFNEAGQPADALRALWLAQNLFSKAAIEKSAGQ